MNLLVITIFALVFTLPLLVGQQLLPGSFAYLPELLSGLVLVGVAGKFVVTRRFYLGWQYALVLGAIGIGMLCAVAWQSPSAGASISGLRQYFKFLPLLLLPAVFEFTPRQIKTQLIVLAGLLALQPPVTFYQRFVQFASEMHTGDFITGTVASSGATSLLMVGMIAFLTCAYLRGKLNLIVMMGATAFYCIPTMLNETKIALALIPLALLLPLVSMPNRQQAFRKMVPVLGSGVLTLVAFIAVYDFIAQYSQNYTPISSFLTEAELRHYLYTGNSSAAEIGYVGRIDSIVLALERQSRDPIDLIFGLGSGNLSPSNLRGFAGAYTHYNDLYGANQTQATRLIWELGLFGAFAYVLLLWYFAKDAWWVSRQTDFSGYVGHAWFACVVMFVPAFFYLTVLGIDELSAPFWFYSGLVAATKSRALATRAEAPRPQTPMPHAALRTRTS